MRERLDEEPVRIVAADPRWPLRFESERALLCAAIAPWVLGDIEHVGSTSVPGLDAKPIIDILVGVADLDSSRAAFPVLATLDYQYAPYRPAEMHWFCKPGPARRTHHLHLVPVDSPRYRDELDFRDYLRSHADAATEYSALKHRLATRFATDREAYTQAKTSFVERVLRLSESG